MNNYRDIDMLRTTELYVARKGWFKPVYTLTDGQFDYGQIRCAGAFTRAKNITTSDANFSIKPLGIFGKQVQIINRDNAEVIGNYKKNIWDTRIALDMNCGFHALLKKGKGIFSRKMFWSDDQSGDYMEIINTYKCTKPFKVKLDQNIIKKQPPLALLSLIGINIMLIKEAQAAASI